MYTIVLKYFLKARNSGFVKGTVAIDEPDPLVEDHYFISSLAVSFVLSRFHLLDLCPDLVLHGFLHSRIAE